jgi:DNA-binding response OmpR family regulator
MRPKILLVDDNDAVLYMMRELLEAKDFEVVAARNVTEALSQIVTQHFDVLITDLHMPGPGDGFTVATAMRHSQPNALTLVLSGFPDVKEAMAAILLQADEVLVKPYEIDELTGLIRRRMLDEKAPARQNKESVASILERDAEITIQRWLARVRKTEELNFHSLADADRTGHLPELMKDIAGRLRETRIVEAIARPSPAALEHGRLRYRQGYDAPMMVQESRILQVCLFETIQRNIGTVDFSSVLPDIMLIADEVDSQLTQSVRSFLELQSAVAA